MSTAPGFGTLEMVLLVALIGTLITYWVTQAPIWQQQAAALRTTEHLDQIDAALSAYGRTMARLPCPDQDGDGYGDEVEAACAGFHGLVPYRDLGLPPEHARNGGGRPFLYAVDGTFTTETGLPCRQGNPTPDMPLSEGSLQVNDRFGYVYVLLSLGRDDTGSDSAAVQNRTAGSTAFYSQPQDGGVTRFDDRVRTISHGVLLASMDCLPDPPPFASPTAHSIPTDHNGLTAAAADTLVWTAVSTDSTVGDADRVWDTGRTLVTLTSGVILQGSDGTIAVDGRRASDGTQMDAGLGLWSRETQPRLDSDSGPAAGGDLTWDPATVSPRSLTITFPSEQERLSLAVSGLTGLRMVDRQWRRTNDPFGIRCLSPPDRRGICAIAWVERLLVQGYLGDTRIGQVELRGCYGVVQSDENGGPLRPLVFTDGFDRLEITPLSVVDTPMTAGLTTAIPNAASAVRLRTLETSADAAAAPSPHSEAILELCP